MLAYYFNIVPGTHTRMHSRYPRVERKRKLRLGETIPLERAQYGNHRDPRASYGPPRVCVGGGGRWDGHAVAGCSAVARPLARDIQDDEEKVRRGTMHGRGQRADIPT